MTDDELRALGLGSMYVRLHEVEIHCRDNERKIIHLRKVIDNLINIIIIELVAVMAFAFVIGCLIGDFLWKVISTLIGGTP